MSSDMWSSRGNYLTKDQIIELLPKEGKEFFDFFQENEIDEEKFSELNDDMQVSLCELIELETGDAKYEEIKVELLKKWESLKAKFKDEYNCIIDAEYPTGSYEGGDSQELYFCVNNFWIINPDLSSEIKERLESFDVILGG